MYVAPKNKLRYVCTLRLLLTGNKNRLQQKSSDLCHSADIKNRTPYLHNKSHKNAVSSKIINAVKMIPFNINI